MLSTEPVPPAPVRTDAAAPSWPDAIRVAFAAASLLAEEGAETSVWVLLEAAGLPALLLDARTVAVVGANAPARRMLGAADGDAARRLVHPEDQARVCAALERIGESQELACRVRGADGWLPVRLSLSWPDPRRALWVLWSPPAEERPKAPERPADPRAFAAQVHPDDAPAYQQALQAPGRPVWLRHRDGAGWQESRCVLEPAEGGLRLHLQPAPAVGDGWGARYLRRHGLADQPWVYLLGEARFRLDQPPEDQPADAWLAEIHPADRPRAQAALLGCAAGLTRELDVSYRLAGEDPAGGRTRWGRTRGRPERDASGQIARIIGAHMDVTAQREAEGRARTFDAYLNDFLRSFPDAVAFHRDGRLASCNAAWARHGGPEGGERLILELFHPEDWPAVIEQIQRAKAGDAGDWREARLRGAATRVSIFTARIPGADGEPLLYTIARDTAPQRDFQVQLAQVERMATLGQIAAGVAHEINNPLTYVLINLVSLKEDLPDLVKRIDQSPLFFGGDLNVGEDIAQRLDDAYAGVQRIQEIVSDLKTFSRGEEGDLQPVDVRRTLRMACNMARHELKYRTRTIEDLPEEPLVVSADEGRLGQVFLNLLLNAAHAFPEGERAQPAEGNEIRIRAAREGDEVVVEIADNGCGIAPEILSRVFEPFFTTRPAGQGSGLGLSICEHILRSFQGRLTLESAPGQGTRAAVRIPLFADPLLEDDPPALEPRASAAPAEPPAPDPAPAAPDPALAPRPRLLIVDDERSLCLALQRQLSPEFDVVVTTDGSEAIEVLSRDTRFDFILCDLRMQQVSGQEVYHWIGRNLPFLRHRLIFITAGAADAGDRRFLETIENLVIDKPFDPLRLRRLLRHLHQGAEPEGRAPEHPSAGNGSAWSADVPLSAEGHVADRRRAPRYPAPDLGGFLEIQDSVFPFRVIDHSESGIRVRIPERQLQALEPLLPALSRNAGRAAPLEVFLRRLSAVEVVQAQALYVRRVPAEPDLCFRFVHIAEQGRKVLLRWLDEAQTPAAEAR